MNVHEAQAEDYVRRKAPTLEDASPHLVSNTGPGPPIGTSAKGATAPGAVRLGQCSVTTSASYSGKRIPILLFVADLLLDGKCWSGPDESRAPSSPLFVTG